MCLPEVVSRGRFQSLFINTMRLCRRRTGLLFLVPTLILYLGLIFLMPSGAAAAPASLLDHMSCMDGKRPSHLYRFTDDAAEGLSRNLGRRINYNDVAERAECVSFLPRGGTRTRSKTSRSTLAGDASSDPYALLALAILPRLGDDDDGDSSSSPRPMMPDLTEVTRALRSLSTAQKAFKGLDGAAHEAYGLSKGSSALRNVDEGSGTKVTGRAFRSAARAGCTADGLFALELCELLERPYVLETGVNKDEDDPEGETKGDKEGTLWGREVLLNTTIDVGEDEKEEIVGERLPLSILVLYEEEYDGGAGLDHGGIDDLLREQREQQKEAGGEGASSPVRRGRILVILKDEYSNDLVKTIRILDRPPETLALHAGLVSAEAASVNGVLWRSAGRVLEAIRPVISRRKEDVVNSTADASGGNGKDGKDEAKGSREKQPPTPVPAIHFVGRSLAGGVTSLAAAILDGSLPMPVEDVIDIRKRATHRKKKRRRTSKSKDSETNGKGGANLEEKKSEDDEQGDGTKREEKTTSSTFSLEGYARGRSSAVALGPPPCLSANVKAAFVTSVIHGDDIICRTTKESLDRLCRRTHRVMGGGILGRRVGWMSDAVSLTVSGLRSHAHGSEGEEFRLAVPGRAYLVRPRRLGGASSMHEVGGTRGGREALRAAVLWQLNDVLLSRSLWAHHSLDAYIHGLDRVQLRGVATEDDDYEKLY